MCCNPEGPDVQIGVKSLLQKHFNLGWWQGFISSANVFLVCFAAEL